MAVTQKDVAKLAGVDRTTVSLVVNNDNRVHKNTRKKVLSIMEKLNYHPNALARSLRNKKADTIGLIIPYYSLTPFVSNLIAGIDAYLSEIDLNLLVSFSKDEEKEKQTYINLSQSQRVDGLILLASQISEERLSNLQIEGIPLVVIGRYDSNNSNIYSVNSDNTNIAMMLTEHFIKQGHQDIVYLNSPANFTISIDRLAGYRQALNKYNIVYREEYIRYGDFTKENAYGIMNKLCESQLSFTGVICADDIMAIGAMKAIKEKKFKIPDDVCIAGFNNISACELVEPPLTSVDINIYKIGYSAAQMITDLIEKRVVEEPNLLIKSKLIIRKSTSLKKEKRS